MGPNKLSYCIVRPSIVAAAKERTRKPGNYMGTMLECLQCLRSWIGMDRRGEWMWSRTWRALGACRRSRRWSSLNILTTCGCHRLFRRGPPKSLYLSVLTKVSPMPRKKRPLSATSYQCLSTKDPLIIMNSVWTGRPHLLGLRNLNFTPSRGEYVSRWTHQEPFLSHRRSF